jgi:hypothetical protein
MMKAPPLGLLAFARNPEMHPTVADAPKPRRGRGRPKLSTEERSTRAALVLGARLANKRTEEICEEFRISRATVYRAFDQAKRLGLLEKARDFLTLDLVPLALAAYEEALREGDLELKVQVAEKVFDGLGITGKHATLLIQAGQTEESFDDFRRKVVTSTYLPPALDGEVLAAGDADGAPGGSPGVPGGTLRPAEPEGTAAGGEGDCQAGLPGPDGGNCSASSARVVTATPSDESPQE